MQVAVLLAPILEVDADQAGGVSVESLPGEVVDDEDARGSEHGCDPVERQSEIMEVMERPARDSRVERPGLGQTLDGCPSKQRALRSFRIRV